MSLQTLKELTLRHCSTQQSSSQSLLRDFDSHLPINRKPPKSSLAHHLRLLDDPDDPPFQPHDFLSQQQELKLDDEEEEEEEPEIKCVPVKFTSVKSSQIQFDHTGPFEPLLLSSDGELPLVQVSIIILTFSLLLILYQCNHGFIYISRPHTDTSAQLIIGENRIIECIHVCVGHWTPSI